MISKYSSQSELSLAAYVTLSAGVPNTARLEEAGMSPVEARHFSENWIVIAPTFVGASGTSATLFQNTQTNEITLAIRGTEPTLADIAADGLLVLGISSKLNPQFTALKAQIDTWLAPGGVLNGQGFSVTGHSLGGYLAAAVKEQYSQVTQAYLYNAPGFGGVFGDLLSGIGVVNVGSGSGINNFVGSEGLSVIAGLGVPAAPSQLILIEPASGAGAGNHSVVPLTDALAVYALYGQLAPGLDVATLGGLLDANANDKNLTLENSLDVLRELITGITLDASTRTPTVVNATTRDQFYTNLYDLQNSTAYQSLAGQVTLVPLGGLKDVEMAAAAQGGIAYRYALVKGNAFAVVGNDAIYTQHNTSGELNLYDATTGTGELTDAYLKERAAFVERKLYYGEHDIPYTYTTSIPAGTTDPYIAESTLWQDRTDGITIEHPGATANTRRVIFGSNSNETDITGANAVDALFGGGGDDKLTGGQGNDYLEGGQGNDTYAYATGDGLDTVLDTDGNGRIEIDTKPLTGGTQFGDNKVFRGKDANGASHLYTFVTGNRTTGGDLMVDGSILIKNYRPADLGNAGNGMGLTLGAAVAESNPQTAQTFVGDPLIHSATIAPGGQGADWRIVGAPYNQQYTAVDDGNGNMVDVLTAYDVDYYLIDVATGNPIESGGPVRADNLIGTTANDHILSGADNDVITATQGGNDLLEAGSGRDKVYAGAGNDVLIGGTEDDILVGGIGDDRLYADTQIDAAAAIDQGNANASVNAQGDWLAGGSGDDTLIGSNANDVLTGGGGSDLLIAGAGDDNILGDTEWAATSFDWTVTDTPTGGHMFQPTDGASQEFPADAAADVIYGGNGNDWVWAGKGNDVILGEGDNDTLLGEWGNDTILGGTGNDTLYGDGGNIEPGSGGNDYLDGGDGIDTLYGGKGDDILIGGKGEDIIVTSGNDTIIKNAGDGVDYIIRDGAEPAGILTYRFGEGLSASTLKNRRGSLLLDFGNGDEMHIMDFDHQDVFNSLGESRFEFADGTVLTGDQLLARGFDLDGTAGDDIIDGTNTTDRILGLAGNDQLSGMAGDDTLVGGTGDDLLTGRNGSDTYLFNRGDGVDTIADEGESTAIDTLQFGPSTGSGQAQLILQSDVTVRRTPAGDLEFTLNGSTDKITVQGWYTAQADTNRLERIVFGDGTALTPADFENLPITGTEGDDVIDGTNANDTILGLGGNDTLDGGAGNDTLTGGEGVDSYTFSFGMGMDTVTDASFGGNTIQLQTGLTFGNLRATQSGNDLLLTMGGIGQGMMLKDYYVTPQEWMLQDSSGAQQTMADMLTATAVANQDEYNALRDDFFAATKNQIANDYMAQGYEWQADGTLVRSAVGADVTRTTQQSTSTTTSNWHWLYNQYPDSSSTNTSTGTTTDYTTAWWGTTPNYPVLVGGQVALGNSVANTDAAFFEDFTSGLTSASGNQMVNAQINWQASYNVGSTTSQYSSTGWINGYYDGQYGAVGSIDYVTETVVNRSTQDGEVVAISSATSSSTTTTLLRENFNTYNFMEIVGGTSDNNINVYNNRYSVVDGGAGNDTLYGGGLLFGGEGNDVLNGGMSMYGGNGNDLLSGGEGARLDGGAGDDILTNGSMLVGGAGNDTLDGGTGETRYLIDPAQAGFDLIRDTGDSEYAYKAWYFGSIGIADWQVRLDYGGQYSMPGGVFDYSLEVRFDSAVADWLRDPISTVDTFPDPRLYDWASWAWPYAKNAVLADPSILRYIEPLPTFNRPAAYDYAALQAAYDAGVIPVDTLEFAAGVGLFDLQLSWGDIAQVSPISGADEPYRTLNLSWNGGASQVQLVIPHADDPLGSGVERIRFADGSFILMQDLIAMAPPVASLDPRYSDLTLIGTEGADVLTGEWANDTLIGLGGDDQLNGGGGNDTLIGGAGNDTLAGGAGDDTYVFEAGNGVDTIVDTVGANTLVFGAGVDPASVTLSLGSLLIKTGNGNDAIHIQNFDPNDVYAPPVIASFQFADGTTLAYDQLLDRGFDIDGTTGNDILNGTNTNDRISGGAGDDILSGGAGNDVLSGGTGSDTYVVAADGGQNMIVETYDPGAVDRVVFASGIAAADLSAVRGGRDNNDLIVSVFGTSVSLTIQGWFDPASPSSVSQFEFADGSLLDIDTIINHAPFVTGVIADHAVQQDQAFNLDVSSMFGDADIVRGDGLTYSVTLANGSALPSWLAFDAATQTFGGTPGNGDVGSLNVTVTATDSGGLSASSSYALNVTNTNDAPVAVTALAGQSANEDAASSFTVPANAFSDADFMHGDSLTYSATMADGSALPSWLAFDAATQTFSGTPGNGDVGILNVSVTATDAGGLSASSDFVLDVLNVNDAPTVVSQIPDQSVTEGQEFSLAYTNSAVVADSFLIDASDMGTPDQVWPSYANYIGGFVGNDTYSFARGDGNIYFYDWDSTPGNVDTVQLTDVLPTDVSVSQDQWGTVILSVNGTADSLALGDWLYSAESRIEQVVFADGTVWGVNEIQSRLSNLPTAGNDYISGAAGRDAIMALGGDDRLFGGAGEDTLLGGAGHDFVEGGGGSDILIGGSGNDDIDSDGSYTDTANDFLDAGTGNDYVYGSISNDLLIGGSGNDNVSGDDGNDVVLFNRGDGNDWYYSDWTENGVLLAQRADAVSLGGGIAYADLAFERDSWNNLILHLGSGETIIFANWFDASWQDNKSISTLQVVVEAMPGYDTNSADPLLNKRIQQFDFVGLANRFEAAQAADPMITTWQLAPHLADFSLGGSDTAAIGGDMAYLYGKNGNLDGLSEAELRAQLNDAGFGTGGQMLTKTDLGSGATVFNDVDFIHGDTLTYSATLADGSALPGWLVFDGVTGTFSGTPGSGDAGILNVAVTATDSGGLTATSAFSLDVIGLNTAPIAVSDMVAITEDNGISVVAVADLLANDTDPDVGDVLSVSAFDTVTALDNTVSLDANGDLVFDIGGNYQSLAAGQSASDSFSYAITDMTGATSTATVDISIAGANDAPVVASPITGQQANEDEAFSFAVPVGAFTDIDNGDVLTYSATFADGMVLPSWLTFDATTQTFSGTPLNVDAAGLNVVVTATDTGGLSASSAFNLDVVNVNDTPTANADTGAATEDGGTVLLDAATLLANDTDPDFIHGDMLNIVGVSQADSGASVSLVNGSVQYDAGALFQSLGQGQTATDTFSYTVSDLAGAISTATVTMTVTGANDGPVTADDSAAVQEDAALIASGNVLTNDTDMDQGTVLSVANAGTLQGIYGSLALNADGSYSYALDNASLAVQSLAAGQVVVETFAYQATDGIALTPATLTVTIAGSNDAPVAQGDTATVDENSLLAIQTTTLLANDTDADIGDAKALVGVDAVSTMGSSISLVNGQVAYDHGGRFNSLMAGQSVTDSFGYTMTDSAGATSSATVNVTVTGVNDGPQANGDSAVTDEDASQVTLRAAGLLVNDIDPDTGDVLSIAAFDAVTVLGNTVGMDAAGNLVFDIGNRYQSLAAEQMITDTFSYTIADSAGATSIAQVNMTIAGLNDGPVAVADTASVQEDITIAATGNVLANDSDIDQGTVLSVADAGDRAGSYGSLTLAVDGSYTYQLDNASPAVQSLGRDARVVEHFSYTATDGIVGASAVLDLFLDGSNDAPILVAPLEDRSFKRDKDFSWQVPDGSFIDIDQGDKLDYAATLADGSALPEWLSFDAATLTFSGETPKEKGFVDVRLTATDSVAASGNSVGSLSVSDVFRISIGHGDKDDSPDCDFNDGRGNSSGHHGAQGGHGSQADHSSNSHGRESDNRASDSGKRKGDDRTQEHDGSGSSRTEELIRAWFEEESASEQYSSFSAQSRKGGRGSQTEWQVNRNVAKGVAGDVGSEWERMNARLKQHLEQAGNDDGISAEFGRGAKPSDLFGMQNYSGMTQLGMGNSQQMKGFTGLKEGLERLGC